MLRTTVIAITGSVGKTTAKECLAAILSARAKTTKTLHNRNDDLGVPRTVRAIRPWHRFAVIEVGTDGLGMIARSARLVRPDVAIVLSVAHTHTNVFSTLEDTAAEKAQLLVHLKRRGLAILNGDDPRVRGMADQCKARVVFFGQGEDCSVVADDVRSAWPERLRFSVRAGPEVLPVQTQLVGTHWAPSVIAALTAARACGVPLVDAVRSVRNVAPFTARMQPVVLPQGAVVIRDEQNGSPDTLDAMLKVLRESTAQRRVLVIGDISDSKAKPKKRQRAFGRLAAELSELAVFVGDHGHHAVRAAVSAGMDPANCHAIGDLRSAAELLKRELRDGDLVFLKSRGTDHVTRILFAQYGTIGCWKMSCKVRSVCDLCDGLQPQFDIGQALRIPTVSGPRTNAS
jgi:UDP-N-acetylmuramoyl-tripeptide--D-alanyl-D-alanine ligase